MTSNLSGELPAAENLAAFLKDVQDLMSNTMDCLRDEITNKGPGPSASKKVMERVLLSERIVNRMLNNLTTNFAVTTMEQA